MVTLHVHLQDAFQGERVIARHGGRLRCLEIIAREVSASLPPRCALVTAALDARHFTVEEEFDVLPDSSVTTSDPEAYHE